MPKAEVVRPGTGAISPPRVQLMRWGEDGEFYEASGVGEQRGVSSRSSPA